MAVKINDVIPAISTGGNLTEKNTRFAFGLEAILDRPIMDKLWEYISTAKENKESINHTLVGNIHSSLQLEDVDDWFFKDVLSPLIMEYKDVFKNKEDVAATVNFIMPSVWVNFQKQHEFNPLHHHAGVYSFVIFMKIPYDWREQHSLPFSAESNYPCASNFEFVYTDIMGKVTNLPYKLDPSWEGTMLFFPAEMKHLVHPFYNCEEERITISGNILSNDMR